MRSTRSVPDRAVRPAAGVAALFVVPPLLVAAASCTSVEVSQATPGEEAAVDSGAEVEASPEAGASDADAGADPFADAGPPRRVQCKVTPCAVALTSTSAADVTGSETEWSTSLSDVRAKAYCVLLDSGRVACWGTNDRGELGRGEGAGVRPSGKADFVVGVDGAKEITETCAVLGDGRVTCWGFGDLRGGGSNAPTTLPLPPVKTVRVGHRTSSDFGCAILASDELSCWGYGLEPFGPRSAFVDAGGTPYATVDPTVVALPAGAAPSALAVGDATFILRSGGGVLSWGDQRVLGRPSSLVLDPYPTPLGLDGVTAIDVAGANVCAVARGRAYCWGYYPDPVTDDRLPPPARSLPEIVSVPEPVTQISAAPQDFASENQRGCAVVASGSVYCWGKNERGQVGDGTQNFAQVPVKVAGLPAPAVSVRALGESACALLEDGSIHCWGDDTAGTLGRGRIGTFSTKPERVTLP
jgi:Regulator of chromosome condensation (RCC1) repeat